MPRSLRCSTSLRPILRALPALLIVILAACEGPIVPELEPLLLAEREPVWSPGGDSIAYVETDSAFNDLIVIVALETGQRTSFDVGRGVTSLDYAPTSSKIAFSRQYRLHEVDFTTGIVTSLGPDAFSFGPAYSPDGSLVAFTSNDDVGQYPPDLWIATHSGQISRVPLPFPRGQMSDVDWSPDGQRLVSAYYAEDEPRLFVTDLAGRDTAFVTPDDVRSVLPAWSSDGEWIAYVRGRTGHAGDLHLVRPDGTDDHRIATNATFPAWSPNGHRIAVSRLMGDRVEVWLMRPDGSEAVRLN